jgi:excisionase family DNA binding protein
MVTERGWEDGPSPAFGGDAEWEGEMVYAYEAEFERSPEEGCWYVTFPDFDDAITSGDSVEDAAMMASDLLTLLIAEEVDNGRELPRPTFHEPPLSVVCVDVTEDVIEGTKLLTVKEAAEYLEVSPSRVSQLLSAGQLEAREFHGRRMVTIDSVNRRAASRPEAGRPRKELAAV